MALFVPNRRMTCTRAMRMKRGINVAKANQSSLNSFSERMNLPQTRNRMMTAAKQVHHQQTRRVGRSASEVRAGGGEE